MIEVRNLTKNYGSHQAVRDLSFTVPSGQICGFLGPNGAGKSTTLRMLTGFLAPSEGTISIGGIDAIAEPIEARRHIGYMPELCPLYPEMRVHEYLRYRAALKEVPRREIKGRLEASLEQARITDVSHRIIGQLSKGYRQRVGLADALIGDPPLLVLDEPTAGLDPNQIRQVRELITELAKDKTVLLSTHILPEVEAICDRVLILAKGKLVSEGEPNAMRGGATDEHEITLIGRGTVADFEACLEKVEGLRQVTVAPFKAGYRDGSLVRASMAADEEAAVEKVFAAVANAGLVLRELRPRRRSLEQVFADLTTEEAAPTEATGRTPRGARGEEEE